MTEADKIKTTALNKLDEFVKGELKYLKDNHMTLSSFDINNMLDDFLSDKEIEEVKANLEQIKKSVRPYCISRGIEIPPEIDRCDFNRIG